jgi:hypothetical protein
MSRRTNMHEAGMPKLNRRRLLEIGAVTIPWLNFSQLFAATPEPTTGPRFAAPAHKIKSCIVLFYYGGPSHLDT